MDVMNWQTGLADRTGRQNWQTELADRMKIRKCDGRTGAGATDFCASKNIPMHGGK